MLVSNFYCIVFVMLGRLGGCGHLGPLRSRVVGTNRGLAAPERLGGCGHLGPLRSRVVGTNRGLAGGGHGHGNEGDAKVQRQAYDYRPGQDTYAYENPWPKLNGGRFDWLFGDGWRHKFQRGGDHHRGGGRMSGGGRDFSSGPRRDFQRNNF
ncbi:unnamed protein product, partial [Mesorhabditis belari]|uniref:Uncharacterized protein n=1 Tax=Mesorhabditis belari TaxID=2138241 RepID=A0AAF3F917_9BILA